ncbi:unnamed protein product, partial [Onchocerca ochengi]|uniref:Reverse transcriptase domain-containing protein n=1 Tax=Onchocerca ochengi TaxID=42157 RepID=A0A182EZK8_ONCOC
NHDWLSVRAILAAKNKTSTNLTILFDTVVEADEAINLSNRIFEFTRSARDATARVAVDNRRANYHAAKYQPAKTL